MFGPRHSTHAFWHTYFLFGFPVDKQHTYNVYHTQSQLKKASEIIPRIFCMLFYRKEDEEWEREQQQTYHFTQGYNILHRLRIHYLTLTFIIHNKYISTLYSHICIHIMNSSNFDTINKGIRLLVGKLLSN